jgi:hypothetical protein
VQDEQPLTPDRPVVDRRTMFRGLGGLLAASALTREALAQQQASGLVKRDFTAEEMKLPPAVFDMSERGNFKLNETLGNRMATLKATNNLSGKKTYIAMFSRVYLGPQGRAGAAMFGHLGLWTWQLQWPDPKAFPNVPKGTVIQRALFTGIILDPWSYEPARKLYNPYLKKEVEASDSLFAESYLFYPNGGGSSLDRPQFMDSPETLKNVRRTPHVRWGDKIAFTLEGLFQNEGPHQPRMDGSIWTGDYKSLMDPKTDLVTFDYNFAGLMRAWERPWIGVGPDDQAQLLWNVKGTKLHSVDDLPEVMKQHLVRKYPDRV